MEHTSFGLYMPCTIQLLFPYMLVIVFEQCIRAICVCSAQKCKKFVKLHSTAAIYISILKIDGVPEVVRMMNCEVKKEEDNTRSLD